MSIDVATIAMNRFGVGANEQTREHLAANASLADAQQWLINQLSVYVLPQPIWSSQQAITGYHAFKQQEKAATEQLAVQLSESSLSEAQAAAKLTAVEAYKALRKEMIKQSKALAEQTVVANITTEQPIQARLLDFFSNHFSVSRSKLSMTLLAPTLEVEAIAPYLHGHFSQMLLAVTEHPAMLMYLNNEWSIGPNSKSVQWRRKKKKRNIGGLNENLAREILELHTLGVDNDYTQADIIEFAKALSGWSIGRGPIKKNEPVGFMFRANGHEPGEREFLGKRYAVAPNSEPTQQARLMLADLANHPATINHICTKLARHFIQDTPELAIINSMTNAWQRTQGHLPSVMQALIKHPLSWHAEATKLKSPRDFVISTCRACQQTQLKPPLFNTLEILGQGLFNAGSPAGYPDTQDAWLGASAMNNRIEWASHIAKVIAKQSTLSPIALAQRALGQQLRPDTALAIKRAESKAQGIALWLLSPDFQRR